MYHIPKPKTITKNLQIMRNVCVLYILKHIRTTILCMFPNEIQYFVGQQLPVNFWCYLCLRKRGVRKFGECIIYYIIGRWYLYLNIESKKVGWKIRFSKFSLFLPLSSFFVYFGPIYNSHKEISLFSESSFYFFYLL